MPSSRGVCGFKWHAEQNLPIVRLLELAWELLGIVHGLFLGLQNTHGYVGACPGVAVDRSPTRPFEL